MPTLEDLQKTIADWNEQHPVGTPVSLQNGFGVTTETTTSSPAMLFAKADVMIWLTGVINPVNLDRLTVGQSAEQLNAELQRLLSMEWKASSTWRKFCNHADTQEYEERREIVINKLYHRYLRRHKQTTNFARNAGIWHD